MVMRKVLTSIVRDTTPPPGLRHPLSDQTIEDIRACLGLISARERELADARGIPMEKPYYADQTKSAEVVPISKIQRSGKKEE